METEQKGGMGFAIAALVCGFLSIILHAGGFFLVMGEPVWGSLIPGIFGFIANILGIVFGVKVLLPEVGELPKRGRAMAIAGIILSTIVIIIGVYSFIGEFIWVGIES